MLVLLRRATNRASAAERPQERRKPAASAPARAPQSARQAVV